MVLSLLLHSSISLIFIYCCCSQLQYHLSDAFTVGGSSLRPQFATLSTTINPQRAPSKLRMLAPKSSTTSESSSSTMQKINSISSPTLIDNYDTFLLDMWGVMHNGSAPYEGVLQTISELKKAGKKLIIVSNSSKRRENSEKMLVKRELLLYTPFYYFIFLNFFCFYCDTILTIASLSLHHCNSWIQPFRF